MLPSLSYLKRPAEGMKSITCVSPDDMAELIQNVSPAHLTDTNSSVSHQSSETIALSSQLARAKYKVYIIYIVCVMSNGFRLILDRKDISHNQELGVFTVLGTNGNPHAVYVYFHQKVAPVPQPHNVTTSLQSG